MNEETFTKTEIELIKQAVKTQQDKLWAAVVEIDKKFPIHTATRAQLEERKYALENALAADSLRVKLKLLFG